MKEVSFKKLKKFKLAIFGFFEVTIKKMVKNKVVVHKNRH